MTWDDDIARHAWKVGDELPSHNDDCIICGRSSVTSPMVQRFTVRDASTVCARVRFDARHQGAPAYAHGGLVAAVLDDACGYVSFLVQRMFVTAHLKVDYRRPVLLDHEYDVHARCSGIDGRKVHLESELLDGDATIVAEGRGLFITVDGEHFRP